MAHDAEMVGLASWVYLNRLIVELDKLHPGIHQKALAEAKAALGVNPGPNAPAILAVLNEL